MAKHSFEFKKKIVLEYLEGKGSLLYFSKKYGFKDHSQLRKWVKYYRAHGDIGLMRSRKKQKYTFEFKVHVVELYLASELSYQDLALSQGINNPSLICKWVNDFNIAGPDALRPKKKGRKKSLDSNNAKKQIKPVPDTPPVDTSAEHVKQLEDELIKLRIENAFLKELRRLRLEEETLLKKQRESSTASEENSN